MSANDRERVRFTATAAGRNDTTTVNSYHPLEVDRVRCMLAGQLAGWLAGWLACLLAGLPACLLAYVCA